jgi:hypothetical protein
VTATTTIDEPETTPEEAPPKRRAHRIVAVLVAVALVAVGGWALLIRDDGKPSGAIPNASGDTAATVPPVAAGTTDAEGAQLVALLQKGRTATFHATYMATGDPLKLGGELSISVWRKDGKIRQDTVVKSDSSTSHTAGYIIKGHSASCVQQDDQPWTCSLLPDSEADVDGIFGSAANQLQGVDVTVADDTIGGHKASCFSFPASDGTGTLCVTSDGIPVKLAINGEDLTISDLSSSVDDSVFVTPVEPLPTPSS